MFLRARRWSTLCAALLCCAPACALKFDETALDLSATLRPANAPAIPAWRVQLRLENVQGGPERELIVRGAGQLAIYELLRGKSAPTWRLARMIPFRGADGQALKPAYYSLARLGDPYKRIVFSDSGGIWQYPVNDGRIAPEPERLLESGFPFDDSGELQLADFTIDIDHDGYDELLVAGLEQTRLWKFDGENWRALELPGVDALEFSRLDVSGVNENWTRPGGYTSFDFDHFKTSRFFWFADVNNDRRLDLIRVEQPPEQNVFERAGYGLPAIRAREDVALTFHAHLYQDGRFAAHPAHSIRSHAPPDAVYQFRDFNGDGLPDRAECRASGDPVAPLSWFKLYLARGGADGGTPRQPDFVSRSNDPLGFYFFNDLNRDGRLDFHRFQFHYSITSSADMAGIILGREFDLDLECFLSSAEGWPARPSFRKRLELRGTQLRFFIDLNNDFDGDGRPDLAVQDRGDKLSIYLFDPQKTAYAKKPDERLNIGADFTLHVCDVNADGRADVLNFDWEQARITAWISK